MTNDWEMPNRQPDPRKARRVPKKPPNSKAAGARKRPPSGKLPADYPVGGTTSQHPPASRPVTGAESPQPTSPHLPNVPPPGMFPPHPRKPHPVQTASRSPGMASGFARLRSLSLTRIPLPKSWTFWILTSVLVCLGSGGLALALLLKLPALPNCPSIFWPTASASLRLYCAEVAANKRTVKDLLAAIALVNGLPDDHPLRSQVNLNIEEWSQAILELAEESFHQGNLQEAINTAQQIPTNTPVRKLVKDRVDRWQTIWDTAESIYQEAKDALQQQDFPKAFQVAVRLLNIGNRHWETTKYTELTGLITSAREDSSKLNEAKALLERSGLSNLLKAIELVGKIKASSLVYADAQRLLGDIGQAMLDLADQALDRRDYQEALNITRQIPDSAKLQDEIKDFNQLAEARSLSWGGTVEDLKAAIASAQKLASGRPLYSEAQTLISRWQLEIQDVGRLATARQLAQSGSADDLAAAVAEAQLIPTNNPRSAEARELINDWTAQIETIQDRPYLDQAEQLASSGDVSSLQAAIDQASQIQQGRALYSEARRNIRNWTAQVQSIQDQPILDRARQFANAGDIPNAILIAEQIGSGRALSDEARSEVRTWRNQIQGQQLLRQAYQQAGVGSPGALLSAIELAQQVSAESPARNEADRMINIWSQEILRFAQSQAGFDLEGAIATASSIPPRTEAYAQAQQQIQAWKQTLNAGEGE